MCRNIRVLFNFDPPATPEEIESAALQYVRKVSGTRAPSQANIEPFERAVAEIADTTEALLERMVTGTPPRNRETERRKARKRWQQRAERMGAATP